MIVSCLSVNDFLENLADVQLDGVYGKVVYVSTLRQPRDERREASSYSVTVQASCIVVDDEDGNGHLLRCGQDCGVDYMDGEGEQTGSQLAIELRGKIEALCSERGWKIRPGIVGE